MDRALYTDAHAEMLKEHAGEKYRPSNGSEGMMFMARWCDKCRKDEPFRNGTGESCPIVAATMIYRRSEPGYPAEWQYGEDGQPLCTAFEETSPKGEDQE